MTVDVLTIDHYSHKQFRAIHGTLLNVYAEVYAKEIAEDPFFSVERFDERLIGHASSPGWWCVVGSIEGEIAGYAYGASVSRGGGWWKRNGLITPLPSGFTKETGRRTFVLFEIMVKTNWRGKNVARTIHDDLMSQRREERAALTVEREHPKVRALYERWGYRCVAEMRPFDDAPLYDVMILDLPG